MSENSELIFDEHSFLDEITNTSEAHSCYLYFVNNLQNFQNELAEAGYHGEERKEKLRQVWKNLINSCERVGYKNQHLAEMSQRLKDTK